MRGMTIDLGFAHAEIGGCDISFVDVPGHERFIRNMVVGATGIDVALLIVAADDSVMPQTREHAELLALLGVERCVLVLTKLDLVTPDWAVQVEQEAMQLLVGLGVTPIGCIHTSAETGQGYDELGSLLARLARERENVAVESTSWFRMPIDRAFTVAGRGTVVTGSVWHGSVRREDELELWPAGRRVRVRDLQAHHEGRGAGTGRMRLGLNLAAVARDEVGRGHEIATPGYLEPTNCMDVWLAWLRPRGDGRRDRLRVRLHTATSELLAVLRRASGMGFGKATNDADASTFHPDNAGEFGQLRLPDSIVATWGQRFILRDESGQTTIGGGRILRPAAGAWTRAAPPFVAGLTQLRLGSPAERLEETIRAAGWNELTPEKLAARAGLADGGAVATIGASLVQTGRVDRLAIGKDEFVWVHRKVMAAFRADIEGRLAEFGRANPRAPGVPQADWPAWMPRACPARLRPGLAIWLLACGTVVERNGFVVPPGREPEMPEADRMLLAAILREFETAGLAPPGFEALRSVSSKTQKKARELIDLAVARGELIRVADGLWFHVRPVQAAIKTTAGAVRQRGEMTASDIKSVLGMTRKYAIPLVEYFDAIGVTKRVGDMRRQGPKA